MKTKVSGSSMLRVFHAAVDIRVSSTWAFSSAIWGWECDGDRGLINTEQTLIWGLWVYLPT